MKICVTSEGKELSSRVDQRFGRCAYFIIIDSETGNFTALENMSVQNAHGAGVSSSQAMVDNGVSVVVTGNVGGNAESGLSRGGIKIITGAGGTVKEAYEKALASL